MELKSKQEVLKELFDKWECDYPTEYVNVAECKDRILAEDIYAKYNIPVVRASAMDGIAVKSENFVSGIPDTSDWKKGVDFVRADTGDDFDDRFDAIIAIENVEISEDGRLSIINDVTVERNSFVVPSGSTVKKGTLLLTKGIRLKAESLACIVISGKDKVLVQKKPKVAFIPTGTELVRMGSVLERGQNFDSNSVMVSELIKEMGGEPVCYPIVKDKIHNLETVLKDAVEKCDIIVINGGSSKGEEDFNTALLRQMGDLIVHNVAAVPGRPMGVAIIDNKPVVNLSGPSIAAYYGTDWCVRSLICEFLKISYQLRHRIKAVLAEDLCTPEQMEMLVRMDVYRTDSGYMAYPASHHGNIVRALNTNGQFISQIGRSFYSKGSIIEVELCE